jgi:uncharacterized protein YggE
MSIPTLQIPPLRIVPRLSSLLLVATLFSLPHTTWANELPPQNKLPILRTLAVAGYGKVSVPTSLAIISLGVEAQGKTPLEVQQEVARRSAAVMDFLRTQPVTELQTQGVNLSPVYDYSQNQQRIVGYSASNIVRFRVETPKAGALLDQGVKRGASRIDSIQFIATDEALEKAKQTALIKATTNAQNQADTVLNALGFTRRDVINIEIDNATPMPQPNPVPMLTSSMKAAATTPVEGGNQDVQAVVTIHVSY